MNPAAPTVVVLLLAVAPSWGFDFIVRHHGFLHAPELDEISGLAASTRDPELFWGIADSGNAPALFAIGKHGEHRGAFFIEGVTNRDWEALDSGWLDGRPCLMIAETGDNDAAFSNCFLYVVEEPKLPATGAVTGNLPLLTIVSFVYEDGPRDVEAVAWDSHEVWLISKRDMPPRLYRLELTNDEARPAVARRVSELTRHPPPTEAELKADPVYGAYASQVTALDFAPDRSIAVVLTYAALYLYPRSDEESWADAFQREPVKYCLPRLRQAEALTFDASGTALFISSEERYNPLLEFRFRDPAGGAKP